MKNLSCISIYLILTVFILSCGRTSEKTSPFTFSGTSEGIELLEDGHPVFFYQRAPKKSSTGDYVCNNYLHPLYSLNGDTLTEEFPADHPYHTGVFWTWHQLYQNGKSLGDGWIWDGISKDVINAKTENDKTSATLDSRRSLEIQSPGRRQAFS